ncbi:MAG: Plug domain-containing protein [Steroidobacteraceae bacterium]|nr:Plug domain-containing protein [Steroidobacteraceae bacterium]
MLRRNFVSLVSFAVWIACGGQGAVAQDEVADSEQVRGLEEVTVSARKRDESLQDTPLAISAFSSQDLVDIGATGLEDIAARSPGMQYSVQGGQFAGRGTTTIRFRGMDTLAGGPELATPFLDGVPMTGTVGGDWLAGSRANRGHQGAAERLLWSGDFCGRDQLHHERPGRRIRRQNFSRGCQYGPV